MTARERRGRGPGGSARGARRPLPPIRLGVSACLLGQRVRYDGGHKEDAFLTGPLARFVTFVPVCPEVELGLGTPREPIRLERRGAEVRLVAPGSGADHTEAMRRLAERRVAELAELDLCGYVLKEGSPSCGMERVRLWGGGRAPARSGRGAFAAVLVERLPLLPVEEEGRLHDPALRESFVERVFACRRLRELLAARPGTDDLVRFHAREELLLLAHDPEAHRRLGRLLARAGALPRQEAARRYAEGFTAALARPATRGRHVDVLRRVTRHLRELAGAAERRELEEAIAGYRRGLVPLLVPVTLLGHHLRRHGIASLAGQSYLDPDPRELMLRNHA